MQSYSIVGLLDWELGWHWTNVCSSQLYSVQISKTESLNILQMKDSRTVTGSFICEMSVMVFHCTMHTVLDVALCCLLIWPKVAEPVPCSSIAVLPGVSKLLSSPMPFSISSLVNIWLYAMLMSKELDSTWAALSTLHNCVACRHDNQGALGL